MARSVTGRGRAGRGRGWATRLATSFALLVLTASVLAVSGVWYTRDLHPKTAAVGTSLTPDGQTIEDAGMGPTTIQNYLLVGSDTRAGEDQSDPDYGGIGNANEVTGQRSDTIMILRFDPTDNSAAILSLPRDLYVPIAGKNRKDRINSAFSDGADVLINTIKADFGIPIHHYVEVNFQGFRRIVDAVGGVPVYFPVPSRDTHTGLEILTPGCVNLTGDDALKYARSRYFQTFTNGRWRDDPQSDLGRIARQQDFIKRAMQKALERGSTSPSVATELVKAAAANLSVDPALQNDLLGLANRLRKLGSGGVTSYTIPANGKTIGGAAVLITDDAAAKPILDYFRGLSAAPPTDATVPAAGPGNARPPAPAAATTAPPTTESAAADPASQCK